MNWVEFSDTVFAAAKKVFLELQLEHASEDFYAFSLYTDSSAMSVGCSANTFQAFEEKISDEDYEEATPEDISYLRWASSEWAYEGIGTKYLKAACQYLQNSERRSNISLFESELKSVLVEVLLKLKNEGVFQSNKRIKRPIIFITITDDDNAEKIENETAAVLNDEGVELSEFLARYDF